MSSRNRETYSFGDVLKRERLAGCEGKCECCGKESDLAGHHLIACYLASKNPILSQKLVRSITNLQMLCVDCHKKADADQRKWTATDISLIAWSLFDLDIKEVEEAQTMTFSDWGKSKKKKKNNKGRRRKRY
jgi:hypothetical protein